MNVLADGADRVRLNAACIAKINVRYGYLSVPEDYLSYFH